MSTMTEDKTHAYPFRRIYLDPHCAECFKGDSMSDFTSISWSDGPVQPDCPDCGRKPIPYNIDRRSLRKDER